MLTRFSTLLPAAALVAVVTSRAIVNRQDYCSTGQIVCCDGIVPASDSAAIEGAAAQGLSLDDVEGPVGLSCSPSSGIGVGGSGGTCTQNPMCCIGNSWGGLVTIGCSPISVNL